MNEMISRIREIGIVPVVVLENAEDALPLGQALLEGGLPCAEITFRTAAAEEAILRMSKAFPDMLIGAGTVLTTEQADRAAAAGAGFVVSPGLNPRVVKYCIQKEIPIIPGCSSPSDIEQALENGLDVVKFFPAEALGGLRTIKAMAAPYAGVRFMPTGGISGDNVGQYLACDRVIACGGSWMVKESLIKEGRFDQITKLVRQAAEIVKEARAR